MRTWILVEDNCFKNTFVYLRNFAIKKSLKIPKWLWQAIIWLGLWYLTPLSTIFHWSCNQGWTDNTMVKIEVGSILFNLKFSVVDHRVYFYLVCYSSIKVVPWLPLLYLQQSLVKCLILTNWIKRKHIEDTSCIIGGADWSEQLNISIEMSLLPLPEHLTSSPIFSWIRVA